MSDTKENVRQKRHFKPIVYDLVDDDSKTSNDGTMSKSTNDEKLPVRVPSIYDRIGERLAPDDAREVISTRRPGPRKERTPPTRNETMSSNQRGSSRSHSRSRSPRRRPHSPEMAVSRTKLSNGPLRRMKGRSDTKTSTDSFTNRRQRSPSPQRQRIPAPPSFQINPSILKLPNPVKGPQGELNSFLLKSAEESKKEFFRNELPMTQMRPPFSRDQVPLSAFGQPHFPTNSATMPQQSNWPRPIIGRETLPLNPGTNSLVKGFPSQTSSNFPSQNVLVHRSVMPVNVSQLSNLRPYQQNISQPRIPNLPQNMAQMPFPSVLSRPPVNYNLGYPIPNLSKNSAVNFGGSVIPPPPQPAFQGSSQKNFQSPVQALEETSGPPVTIAMKSIGLDLVAVKFMDPDDEMLKYVQTKSIDFARELDKKYPHFRQNIGKVVQNQLPVGNQKVLPCGQYNKDDNCRHTGIDNLLHEGPHGMSIHACSICYFCLGGLFNFHPQFKCPILKDLQ